MAGGIDGGEDLFVVDDESQDLPTRVWVGFFNTCFAVFSAPEGEAGFVPEVVGASEAARLETADGCEAVVAHARIFISREGAEYEAQVLEKFAGGRCEVRQQTKAVLLTAILMRSAQNDS
jgi:hypothetical protein